jgi:hypothetical protein
VRRRYREVAVDEKLDGARQSRELRLLRIGGAKEAPYEWWRLHDEYA